MTETITVGWNESDFVCDGINDDIEINAALQEAANVPGSRVYLRGPHTYNISGAVMVGDSGTLFTGDSTACIKRV